MAGVEETEAGKEEAFGIELGADEEGALDCASETVGEAGLLGAGTVEAQAASGSRAASRMGRMVMEAS